MTSPVKTIAIATLRSALSNKFLIGLLGLDLAIVWMGPVLEYLPRDEKIRVIYDIALATTAFFTMAVGVFLAGWSVPEEVDRKRIYLVISKPVGKGEFFVGKILGLLLSCFLAIAVMGIFVVLIIAFKFKQTPWPAVYALYMNALELLVIVSLALFFSVWSSGTVAVTLSVVTYLVGHASPTMLALGTRSPSLFLGWLIRALYMVLPNLELFNVRHYVAHGIEIPFVLTVCATLYGLTYSGVVLCIAYRLFLRKEL